MSNRKWCEPCRKFSYQSKREARRACRRAGFRVRVYRCKFGNGVHVTSQQKQS